MGLTANVIVNTATLSAEVLECEDGEDQEEHDEDWLPEDLDTDEQDGPGDDEQEVDTRVDECVLEYVNHDEQPV